MQEHANHVSGWILSTFCEVHARKDTFRYPGTMLGKAKVFGFYMMCRIMLIWGGHHSIQSG